MRLVLVLAATAACACGRVEFDARPDAAGSDAPDGDAPLPHACDWSSGPPFPGPALRHAELSSPLAEVDPFLAPGDPLTMYFGSERDGDADIFVATRPALDQPFGQVMKVTELSTTGRLETGLILDVTSTTGYYASNRQIHTVVRDVPGGPLRDTGVVSELAVDVVFQDAWPSRDGLRLTFSAFEATPTQIYTTSRASRSVPWSAPVLSPVNMPGVYTGGATLTADERVMVWTTAIAGDFEIVYAVRADRTQPFSPAQRVVAASSTRTDFEPSIREDGCELFFGRQEGPNDFDIYSLVATP